MRHKAQFMAKPIHAAAVGNSFFTKDLGITSVSGRHVEGFPLHTPYRGAFTGDQNPNPALRSNTKSLVGWLSLAGAMDGIKGTIFDFDPT